MASFLDDDHPPARQRTKQLPGEAPGGAGWGTGLAESIIVVVFIACLSLLGLGLYGLMPR
jgi:hypothetical protein